MTLLRVDSAWNAQTRDWLTIFFENRVLIRMQLQMRQIKKEEEKQMNRHLSKNGLTRQEEYMAELEADPPDQHRREQPKNETTACANYEKQLELEGPKDQVEELKATNIVEMINLKLNQRVQYFRRRHHPAYR